MSMRERYDVITIWDEHQFWVEILEDHAYFVRDFLSPAETQWVQLAQQFIEAFSALRKRIEQVDRHLGVGSPEMIRLAQEIYPVAYHYFLFEGHMQRLRILNQVNLNLTPSYFNGTLNENQEYLRLLHYYMQGQDAPLLPLVDLMDLWLEDQLGHVVLLIRALDNVELPLLERVTFYRDLFRAHILKNEAMKGFLRFIPTGLPIERKFARDVAQSVIGFTSLVTEVVELYKDDEVLNQATLRFLEHHFPEACYFLRKLSLYDPEIYQLPDCPLTKPSFV